MCTEVVEERVEMLEGRPCCPLKYALVRKNNSTKDRRRDNMTENDWWRSGIQTILFKKDQQGLGSAGSNELAMLADAIDSVAVMLMF